MKLSHVSAMASMIFCLSKISLAQTYTFYDLGTSYLPNAISPGAIVANGTVTYIAGTYTGGSTNQAFYIPITWTVSGSSYSPAAGSAVLLTSTVSATRGSSATGVNDSGHICGYYSNATYTNQGFVVTAGSPPTLYAHITGTSGNNLTLAYAINASNEVAGWDDNLNEAYYWTFGGGLTDVGSLGIVPTAEQFSAINNSGVCAGFANFSPTGQTEYSATWFSGWTEIDASGGGIGLSAYGINNSGYTCGNFLNGSGNQQAWRFDSSGKSLIGSSTQLPSTALGIDDLDYVVGEYTSTSAPNPGHAYVSTSGSTILDLNNILVVTNLPSTVTLATATAIDTRNGTKGDIVGTALEAVKVGKITTYVQHGYLLVQS